MAVFHPVVPSEGQEMAKSSMEVSEGSHPGRGTALDSDSCSPWDLYIAHGFQAFS